jgi:hypothetical protein
MTTKPSTGDSSVTPQTGEIPRQEKEQELLALLRSGFVRESTDLYTLLSYLGKRSLENGGPLKEYTIGVEGLGKPEGYDPRLDPTVRVDISKLRAKLREYYDTWGAARPVHLEIPKGEYHLTFVRRVPLPPAPRSRLPRWGLMAVAMAAAAVVLVTGSWFLAPRLQESRAPALAPELEAFWAPFLQRRVPTVVSYGTPLFLKLDGVYYRDPRVNRPEDGEEDETIEKIVQALEPSERRWAVTYTGVGETEALFMITRLLASQGVPLSIQRSAHLSWEDMKGKHVILVGSHKNLAQIPGLPVNPKFGVASYPSRVENLRPEGDEPTDYRTARNTPHGVIQEEFALVSVYEGLIPGTFLMVLSCSSTEGTAAAAEYVTRADTVRDLLQAMGVGPRGRALPRAFQVVVRAQMKRGVPIRLSRVAHHVLAP